MDLTTYAVDHAAIEAMVRGLRASFLTEENYTQMTKNCESVAALKQVIIISPLSPTCENI